MRCVYHIINSIVYHIINSIVQDDLKLISRSLEAIQIAIQFIYPSNKSQEFNALCKSVGLKKRKFCRDIGHRWNSTCLMLKYCVGYNNILSYYVSSKVGEIKITLDDWEKCLAFLNFLKVFYDTTLYW